MADYSLTKSSDASLPIHGNGPSQASGIGKSYSLTAKFVTTTAVLVAMSYLFYTIISHPRLRSLPPYWNEYIQKAKRCVRGEQFPGCENGVYCVQSDPSISERYPRPTYPQLRDLSCNNHVYFPGMSEFVEGSRMDMMRDIKENTGPIEEMYDNFMDAITAQFNKMWKIERKDP
jgi:hypothetical protein